MRLFEVVNTDAWILEDVSMRVGHHVVDVMRWAAVLMPASDSVISGVVAAMDLEKTRAV